MENWIKYLCGALSGMLGFFSPVKSLVLCAVLFVAIDFITGILADSRRAKNDGRQWGIESRKAWKTVMKLLFIMAGIVLAWLIDSQILNFLELRLANLFTGFVCGVEFWSYLENAAEVSGHPVFRSLKKFLKAKVEKEIGDK